MRKRIDAHSIIVDDMLDDIHEYELSIVRDNIRRYVEDMEYANKRRIVVSVRRFPITLTKKIFGIK